MKNRIPSHLSASSVLWIKKVLKVYEFDVGEQEVLFKAAQALDRSEQAREEIVKHGLLIEDARGSLKKNPAVTIETSNLRLFHDYAKTLKITNQKEEIE